MSRKIALFGLIHVAFVVLIVENAAILSSHGTPTLLRVISETDAPLWQACSEGDGNYPNYQDCSTYITCSNGYAYLMRCPVGLIWNVDDRRCDWPHNTQCIQNKLPIATGPL